MELSRPKTKKFQKGIFQLKNTKKKNALKNFLYFRKWNYLGPSLRNSYIFLKTIFIIFLEGNIRKNDLRKIAFTFFIT